MARTTQNSRSASRKTTKSGSFGGVMDMARERPIAAAATAAGAVAASVFLWSKRAQISDQLSQLSDQVGEWTDAMGTDRADAEFETVGGDAATSNRSPARRSRTSNGRRGAHSGEPVSARIDETPVA